VANAAVGSNVGSAMLEVVPVSEIQLDRDNPRIRKFLESYGPNPSPDQFFLALGAGGDDESDSSATFEKLKNSILGNGGIIQPIIVNRRPDGSLVCVEGNTRVALYKSFLEENRKGSWSTIPALVYGGMTDLQIDSIRLQVHMVGTRPWDPYSKAKYLHFLHIDKQMPLSILTEFCGGRQKEITEFINAFSEMEKYYRPIVAEGSFDTSRFSGFVELQKPGLKEALLQTKHTLSEFARWIHEQKLFPLNTVRLLPRILRNEKATEIFLKHGARKAAEVLDRPGVSKALADANIGQLAAALSQAVYDLPWHEAEKLKQDPGGEVAQSLNEALDALSALLKVHEQR
jgi:hypothetical protein